MAIKIPNWLIELDYFINDKLINKGKRETISSRAYRHHKRLLCCKVLCFLLGLIDKDHCRKAYLNDSSRNPRIPKVAWDVLND